MQTDDRARIYINANICFQHIAARLESYTTPARPNVDVQKVHQCSNPKLSFFFTKDESLFFTCFRSTKSERRHHVVQVLYVKNKNKTKTKQKSYLRNSIRKKPFCAYNSEKYTAEYI
jgi:hypothetical protein